MMRFLADENISRQVISRLRVAGFEVVSISETRPGIPDEDVLHVADTEECILITEDRDFGELVIRQRLEVRGLILLELDPLSNSAEAEAVVDVVSTHKDRLLGNLVVIEPGRVRIRPLLR